MTHATYAKPLYALKAAFNVRRKADAPSGVMLYRGPSMLDPDVEVIAIMTLWSANEKTAGSSRIYQPQVYILRADDTAPQDHVKARTDTAICGDCPFAGGRGCYVIVHNAPRSVWAAFQRGRYPMISDTALALLLAPARYLRLGAYGDPAALPLDVLERLERCKRTDARMVGYTHQWRTADTGLARFCMASVETVRGTFEARAMGYRTFRVRAGDEPVLTGEVVCPASHEGGQRRTCETCRICDGTARGVKRASVAIIAHGARAAKALAAARASL